MGSTHCLARGLANVRTEASFQVLAYNIRVISIIGIGPLMEESRLAQRLGETHQPAEGLPTQPRPM